MKVFQIENDICYWDATNQFPTVESTIGYFPPSLLFVEAPDYVFEGWAYLNGQFVKPTPPEGWLYDDATGTFYQENAEPAPASTEERLTELEQAFDILAEGILGKGAEVEEIT